MERETETTETYRVGGLFDRPIFHSVFIVITVLVNLMTILGINSL